MDRIKDRTGYIVITLVSLFSIIGVCFLDPIAQDHKYHQFIDQQTILGIPNFWNVLSNLPFLLVGIIGLYSIINSRKIFLLSELKIAYILFFLGVSLVAFGSGYYHLSPNNNTLLWDRLPMTIAFMALFAIIINECTSTSIGKHFLWPLVFVGMFSVLYWHNTESNGAGDLRLYVLVQFLPMLIIPALLLLFKSKFTHIHGYWYLLLAYAAAKVFEYYDVILFNVFFLSGHSLKHIIAAVGIFVLLKTYNNRVLTEVKI